MKLLLNILSLLLLTSCTDFNHGADKFDRGLTCGMTKSETFSLASELGAKVFPSKRKEKHDDAYILFGEEHSFVIYFKTNKKLLVVNREIVKRFLFWTWGTAYEVTKWCKEKE